MIKPHQSADDDSPFDHNGLLKDGRTARIRMTARDSGTVRGAIAADRQRISDGNPHALHRPGNRVLADAPAYDAVAAAYEDAGRLQAQAWKRGPGGARLDAGPPVADSTPGSPTLADSERIKNAAYQQMVRDGEQAWKRLGQGAGT
jgi:hypothetical protein